MPTAIERMPSLQSAGRASGSSAGADEHVGQQQGVAAAVAAFAADDRHFAGGFPVLLHDQAFALGAQGGAASDPDRLGSSTGCRPSVGEHGPAFDDLELGAAERCR